MIMDLDVWLYLLMDIVSLLMYGHIMYDAFIYLLYLFHGSEEDDVISYLHMYILLSLSYPVTCTVDE